MDAYKALAASYDRLTNDVDYRAVVDFYRQIMEKEGVHPRSAVDLACGTGSVAQLLAKQGIPTIGVDLSEDMLTQAQLKTADMDNPPRYICQSLDKLKLYKAVDLAVCALDSLDYITEPDRCRQAIRRIYRALNPGGLFVFDVNTPEKLRAMDGQVFLDETEDTYCVWRTEYRRGLCTYFVDLFRLQSDGAWDRQLEIHRQRAYTVEELTAWLKAAGFADIRICGDMVRRSPREGEQRIYFTAIRK